MLIYGAPDNSANTDLGRNFWAYCYWTNNEANKTNPTSSTFFWASYDFMYDSSTAQTRTGKSDYATGNCSHCNVDAHTFIHEMGHVFGIEDYYDYSIQYSPAGGFSMQDMNIGGHDPYSLMAYGWADPYIPTSTTTITINDFQSSHDVILLSNKTNVNSPFDEYLLIELYTPTGVNKFDCDYAYNEESGYNKGPTQAGIRVWHVDGRLAICTYYDSRTGEASWSSTLTTNPKYESDYGIYHAMSNTYYKEGDESEDYVSVLGESYADYNILQYIRNNSNEDYCPTSFMDNSSLFKAGDSFSMSNSNIKGQFKNSGKLNSNQNLGWSFTVDSLSSTSATITVTKA